ncbi:MAG: SH3 domain-containing protein [Lachnospiraceae bacterium]|nr:SH3 domain-containing protein [Lachnospiraceae bacterium]
MKRFGVDVSEFQGVIDWQRAKNAGVEFAILRCGFGQNFEKQDDKQFEHNASECEKLGIPYGVYLYSYATDVAKAKSEANHVLRLIKGKKLSYPIFYDLEDNGTTAICSRTVIGDMAEVFCNEIINAGYKVGIYASTSWFNNLLTDSRFDKWDKWVAQYYKECQYAKPYVGWQYSSTVKVDGISTNCDVNYFYKDYLEAKEVGALSGGKAQEINKAKDIKAIAREVVAGKWGIDQDRKERLTRAGYDYDAVQAEVNKIFKKNNVKTIDAIAQEVIDGKWGVDKERKDKLTKAGYNYDEVQNRVNEILNAKQSKELTVKSSNGLNLREQAGTSSKVVCALTDGTKVLLKGEKEPVSKDGYAWDYVTVNSGIFKGKQGWVAAQYLE